MFQLELRNSRKRPRLVIFDLDGTITRFPNVWRHLHTKLGTWEFGKMHSQRYLDGEITYKEWAELDCALWKGTKVDKLLEIVSRVEYFDGAAETIRRIKEAGMEVGIVSAGISLFAEKVAEDLGVKRVLSNHLVISNGVLTGDIETNVSLDDKPKIIRDVATSLGIPMSQVAVVGDNVFDMPSEAMLKIAFNPRSKEAEDAADFVVKDDDLRKVLPLILREAWD